jgi:hypothetical protein
MSDKHTSAFPLATDGGHFSEGMTLRQYAAIKLKVPDSGTEWLDEMITKSLQNDFAAKALQGYMVGLKPAQDIGPDMHQARIADAMYSMADAMLRARGAA